MHITRISEYPKWAKQADWLMKPIMFMIQMTPFESLQETHRWNNKELLPEDIVLLDSAKFVSHEGIPTASPRWWCGLPLMHIPIFGGWRQYVVIGPKDYNGIWYVGWKMKDTTGYSLLPVKNLVRVLIGSTEGSWFGLDANGSQISILKYGEGKIYKGGPFKKVPLR